VVSTQSKQGTFADFFFFFFFFFVKETLDLRVSN
jgi:hypothetical protein